MSDLYLLQKKQDSDNNIYYTFKKQLNTINDLSLNKDSEFTIKLLEKQFLNTGIFKEWINNFSYNKLQIYNETDPDLFETQLNTVIKLLLFFRHLNLLNKNNTEFIKKLLNNVELFTRCIFINSEYDSVVNNCSKYINKNKDLSVLNNFINLKENTVEDKNTVNNNSVNINSEIKNTVQNENVSNEDFLKNTEDVKSCKILDNLEISENKSTVENKNEIPKVTEKTKKSPKRNKYKKTDKLEAVKKTVNNIINYKIKNTELYIQAYNFNRSNIKLFSNIYSKFKIEYTLDDTEFNNIYINFDKNKNRFLRICKFYYEISKEEQLINSNLLFLPYCFNEISIKDDCINLFKQLIIEFINDKKC